MIKKKCFIISECNTYLEQVQKIKEILNKKEYLVIIAEDLPKYNYDAWENNIRKPIIESDLIIVILNTIPIKDKNYANFNVSFEFGYARGYYEDKEKIILLFDGDLSELPFDIKRDCAINLKDKNLYNEIERCIKYIEEKGFGKLRELPKGIEQLLLTAYNSGDFAEFAEWLNRLANLKFGIVNSSKIIGVIDEILGNRKKYCLYNPTKEAKEFLGGLCRIFYIDKTTKSKRMLNSILMRLPSLLNETNSWDIIAEYLNLCLISDETHTYEFIIDFLIDTLPTKIDSNFDVHLFKPDQYSNEHTCTILLDLLLSKKSNNLSNIQKEFFNKFRNYFIECWTIKVIAI